jgi:hypothetical protein
MNFSKPTPSFSPSAAEILAVQNAIANYCIYLDNKDFPALETVFAGAEAVTDYRGISNGDESALITGSPKIVEWLQDRVKGRATQHALSTQKLEFFGEKLCNASTYFSANTWGAIPTRPGDNAAPQIFHLTMYGCYIDVLTKNDDGKWRIQKRGLKTHVRIYGPNS